MFKSGDTWIGLNKDRLKRRRMMVFNDIVIIAKPKSKKQFQVMSVIESSSLLFSGTPSSPVAVDAAALAIASPRGGRLSFKRSSGGTGSVPNVLGDTPELNLEIINLVTKDKFTIQLVTAAEKREWVDAINRCTSNSQKLTLTVEEDLKAEREARKNLQEKNVVLWRRVKELEKQLEEEQTLRRSAEERLKGLLPK